MTAETPELRRSAKTPDGAFADFARRTAAGEIAPIPDFGRRDAGRACKRSLPNWNAARLPSPQGPNRPSRSWKTSGGRSSNGPSAKNRGFSRSSGRTIRSPPSATPCWTIPMSTATWFCTSARSAGVSPTAKSSRAARSATSPGGAFRASCNVFLVVEGDRRILVDAGNGAPRGSLLAKLRADGVDPATNALPAR